MHQQSQVIQLPFPIKGVDRSMSLKGTPAGVANDARNVRGLDRGDRVRGGKRPGTIRPFATPLTGDVSDLADPEIEANQILELAAYSITKEGLNTPLISPPTSEYWEYNPPSDFLAGSDEWKLVSRAGTTFASTPGAITGLAQIGNTYQNERRQALMLWNTGTAPTNTDFTESVYRGPLSYNLLAIVSEFKVNNDVEVTIATGPNVLDNNVSNFENNSFDHIGPIIRCNQNATRFIMAELVCKSVGTVNPEAGAFCIRINKYVDGVKTTLVDGPTFEYANPVPGTCQSSRPLEVSIRLYESGSKIFAQVFGFTDNSCAQDGTGEGLIQFTADSPFAEYSLTSTDQTDLSDSGQPFRYGGVATRRFTSGVVVPFEITRSCKSLRFSRRTDPSIVIEDDEFGETVTVVAAYTRKGIWRSNDPAESLPSMVETPVLNDMVSATTTAGHSRASVVATSWNRKFYSVDGETSLVFDPATNTVQNWKDTVTAGTFPDECRLVSVFRGRLVLANQVGNPSIWYMSRVFEPGDWDIGSDPFDTSAQGGVNTRVGQPADAITALMPFTQDYMVFGCTQSLWLLSGDPGYNGTISLLSDEVGVVGPKAWVQDEQGTLYFMGQGGLYKMRIGEFAPRAISANRINDILGTIKYDDFIISMGYDGVDHVVHIFLTPKDSSQYGRHVAYDVRRDAFWLDDFESVLSGGIYLVGPTSCTSVRGGSLRRRRVLMGGFDGRIRSFDDTVLNDDMSWGVSNWSGGFGFESYVRLPHVMMGGGAQRVMLTETHVRGVTGNGPIFLRAFFGDTAERVNLKLTSLDLVANQDFQKTISETGLYITQSRGGGNVMQFVIGQDSTPLRTWSIEGVSALVKGAGRVRLDLGP